MSRDLLLALVRWLVGLVLLGLAWYLVIPQETEDPIDVPRLLLGAAAFVAGIAMLWPMILHLATKPLLRMVDSLFSPGGRLEKPILNLKLPAHYVNEGRYEEALAEYRKILRAHPGEAEAYEKAIWLEAEVFQRRGEAMKLLRRAKRRRVELDERVVRFVEREA